MFINRYKIIRSILEFDLSIYLKCQICICVLFLSTALSSFAQDSLSLQIPKAQLRREVNRNSFMDSLSNDSLAHIGKLQITVDSLLQMTTDEVRKTVTLGDTVYVNRTIEIPSENVIKQAIENRFFIPNSKKAMWLAIVFPGGGQIYNRKYWKLPLIYGGFLGCVYALNWNNTMYRDYSQAYIDIMDDDPNTISYENFIPKGYDVSTNLTRIQNLFKRKKNYYRRYRDLSLFCMIGVYALSIIDAYVDAELSGFDISRDLSMKVRPSIIQDKYSLVYHNQCSTQSYGVKCSLIF